MTTSATTTRYRAPLFLSLIAAGLAGNYFKFPIFLDIEQGSNELDVARYRPLEAKGAVSREELDDAIQASRGAKAQVDAAADWAVGEGFGEIVGKRPDAR